MPGAGLDLHVVEAGAGPAVVLLHGFPDFWYGWRHQIPALADAGYRVIAPDLRGYGGSDRPRHVRDYSLTSLCADVAALVRVHAPDCHAIIGHDWGGIIAWYLAAAEPALTRSTAVLNAPHPDAYLRALRRHPRQALRSWYVLANQLPLLPEYAMRAGNFRLLRRVIGRTEDGAPMATRDEIARYEEAFRSSAARRAALNYYRAAARAVLRRRRRPVGRIRMPVLVLWGERDRWLDVRLLDELPRFVPQLEVARLPHTGHFLHWQDPGTVNARLLHFLRARGRAVPPAEV